MPEDLTLKSLFLATGNLEFVKYANTGKPLKRYDLQHVLYHFGWSKKWRIHPIKDSYWYTKEFEARYYFHQETFIIRLATYRSKIFKELFCDKQR